MKKINKYLREKILWPWIKKHPVECSILIHESIAYQMYMAGIRFEHINKWLALNNIPRIKAYTELVKGKKVRIFRDYPTPEQRQEIKTPIYEIR